MAPARHEFARIPVEGEAPSTAGTKLASVVAWMVASILLVSFAAAIFTAITSPDPHDDESGSAGLGGSDEGGLKPSSALPESSSSSPADLKQLMEYYHGSDLGRGFYVHAASPDYAHNVDALAASFDVATGSTGSAKKRPISIGIVGNAAVGGFGNCHLDAFPVLLQQQLGDKFKVKSVSIGPWCGASPSSTLSCSTEMLGEVDVVVVSFSFQSGGDKTRYFRGLNLLLDQMAGRVHIVDVSHSCDADLVDLVGQYTTRGANILCLAKLVSGEPGLWGVTGDWLGHTVTRRNSSGIVWRNWRLGPMGHQIIADALTFLYVKAASSKASADARLLRPSSGPVCRMGEVVTLPPNVDEVPEADLGKPECALDSNHCGYVPIAAKASYSYKFGDIANDQGASVHVCCCCNDELCVKEQFQPSQVSFSVKAEAGQVTMETLESFVGRECVQVAKLAGKAKGVTIEVTNLGLPATLNNMLKIGKVLVL